MSRGVHAFKQSDLMRAIRATRKVGCAMRIEIDLERRRMSLTPVTVGETRDRNEWDEEFGDAATTEIR
jgi:hypothetical protein